MYHETTRMNFAIASTATAVFMVSLLEGTFDGSDSAGGRRVVLIGTVPSIGSPRQRAPVG
jgi:hypothetical protein